MAPQQPGARLKLHCQPAGSAGLAADRGPDFQTAKQERRACQIVGLPGNLLYATN